MDLRPYLENLRSEFAVAAEGTDPDGRALAERLFAQLEAATRLMLLDVLSDAADEITRDLAPGSVQLRLRGREPAFAVTPPAAPTEDAGEPEPRQIVSPPATPAPETDDGGTSRINFRLPDSLKASIEEAAGRAGLSVNAWLVRAASAFVAGADTTGRAPRRTESKSGQHITGWVR